MLKKEKWTSLFDITGKHTFHTFMQTKPILCETSKIFAGSTVDLKPVTSHCVRLLSGSQTKIIIIQALMSVSNYLNQ